MLSSRLLSQFVAVAEELHFSRAAARLNMAQSPLSQAIQRLEEFLGVPLFERNNRSVTLTIAGDVFLQRAKSILNSEHAAVASARRAHAFGSGRLTVGFVGTVAYGIVPRILRSFRTAHPAVELVIEEMTTRDQRSALNAGTLDAGIVRLPLPNPAGLMSRLIELDRFALALPNGHARATRRSVDLADFVDEPFVAYSHDRVPLIHSQAVAACLHAGFYPNIVCEAWQASSILSLVAAGLGVALVPSHLASMKHEGVELRPIRPYNERLALPIVAIWLGGNTHPTLAAFVDHLGSFGPRNAAASQSATRPS